MLCDFASGVIKVKVFKVQIDIHKINKLKAILRELSDISIIDLYVYDKNDYLTRLSEVTNEVIGERGEILERAMKEKWLNRSLDVRVELDIQVEELIQESLERQSELIDSYLRKSEKDGLEVVKPLRVVK
jgi:hypothetical protein